MNAFLPAVRRDDQQPAPLDCLQRGDRFRVQGLPERVVGFVLPSVDVLALDRAPRERKHVALAKTLEGPETDGGSHGVRCVADGPGVERDGQEGARAFRSSVLWAKYPALTESLGERN